MNSRGLRLQRSRSVNSEDESQAIAASVCDAIEMTIIQPMKNASFAPVGDENRNVPLAFEKFNKWYKVLKNDDVKAYENIMKTLDPQQRDILREGIFIYGTPPKQLQLKRSNKMAEFGIPFHIALSNRAFGVVEKMLDDEIDMSKMDVGRANVIHVLIISASEKRQQENDYLKLLDNVFKHLTAEEVGNLLIQENAHGYRPLELAVRLGIYGIFREILNYPGHLVERSFEAGLNTYSVYNLSPYQWYDNRRRTLRSPLRLLAYATPDGKESLKKYGIIHLPVIEQWANLLMRRNLIFLVIWWISRVAFNCMMISVDFTVVLKHECEGMVNITDICSRLDGSSISAKNAYLLIGWSFLIAIMDITEVVILMFDRERRLAYKGITNPLHPYIAWTAFYRICQFMLVILAALAPFAASVFDGEQAFEFLLTLKACCLFHTMMSLLYLIEPLPVLGFFAITLRRMVESIAVFIVFLIPMLITFSQFFEMVTDGKYGFTGHRDGMYQLFRLDIGSLDFGPTPGVVVQMVHVTFYVMDGILLMNYLIAVMTNVAADSDEDREILIFLRRLNAVLLAEERYGMWFWKIYYRMRGKQTVYVYAEEND